MSAPTPPSSPPSSGAALALFGLSRILRLDPAGLRCFDNSAEAARASFRVALYVAPMYLLQSIGHYLRDDAPPPPYAFALIELFTYIIGWVLFPLVVLQLAPRLGVGQTALRYVAAYNWFQLVISGVLLPFVLLRTLDVLPLEAGQLFFMMAASAFMLYGWFIARHALNVSGLTATGVVILDLLLSLLVNVSVQQMVSGGGGG